LPIDEIKIDKSFIDDIDDTSSSYPVIDSIISMAQAMDLQLVAEGVETQTQLDYMRAKACDLIQGFYFFKPMPKQQLLDALEQQLAVTL
jgi:sensor c-di-GMP phosphodiesterase-like protein